MDSLTQATLGAAVAHACWQKELGRKALIVGGLLGTLPDLDIIMYPLLDEVQRLYWHRGESHSVWFMMLGAFFFGWLLVRLPVGKWLSLYQASVGVFLIFSTHVLIDLFTVYGTQLLAPVSRKGFSLNNFFIIDPLFTIPLLAGTVGAYVAKNETFSRRLNLSGLLLASFYAAWSFSVQSIADQKFRLALTEKNIAVSRQVTSAGAFTTLLWRHIAETPDGFLIAYWSWFDDADRPIRFQFIPRSAEVIEQIRETRTFQTVEWFSQGWWFVADKDRNPVKVVDLRFSEIPSGRNQTADEWEWPFAWEFNVTTKDESPLKAVIPDLKDPVMTIKLLGQRIGGNEGWIATSPEAPAADDLQPTITANERRPSRTENSLY
ncbi:MAG: metal-dependent hydrolase [Desulforhopalus sp.]